MTQLSKGLVAQKKLFQTLYEDETLSGLVKVLLRFFSLRSEEEFTVSMFRRNILSLNDEKYVQDILTFYTNFYELSDSSSLIEIINITSSDPLVDRYISIVKILEMLTSFNEHPDFSKKFLIDCINSLKENIHDKVFYKLLLLVGGKISFSHLTVEPRINSIIDTYTEGKYDKVINLSIELLKEHPTESEIYEIFVNSCIQEGLNISSLLKQFNQDNSLLVTLLEDLRVYLENQQELKKASESLEKIALVFSNSSWSASIKYLASKYTTSQKNMNFINNLKLCNDSISNRCWPQLCVHIMPFFFHCL